MLHIVCIPQHWRLGRPIHSLPLSTKGSNNPIWQNINKLQNCLEECCRYILHFQILCFWKHLSKLKCRWLFFQEFSGRMPFTRPCLGYYIGYLFTTTSSYHCERLAPFLLFVSPWSSRQTWEPCWTPSHSQTSSAGYRAPVATSLYTSSLLCFSVTA